MASTTELAKTATVVERRRISIGSIISKVVIWFLLLLIAFIMLLPFYLMVSQSFRQGLVILTTPIEWIPSNLGFANYQVLFSKSLLPRWFFNSSFVTISVTILETLTGSMAGYAFARKDFPGRDVIFWMFMAMLMVPGQVTLIPNFLILRQLDWINTYQGLILPLSTSVFSTFLMRQYMKSIPRDYDDAAFIDGANDFTIFFRVLMPLCQPAIAVLATLSFINSWNDFLYPLIVTQRDEMRTLQVALATSLTQQTEAGVQFAATTFTFLPTAIIFLALQRYVVRGVALSGVKG